MDLNHKMIHRRIRRDNVLVPRYSPTWDVTDAGPEPTDAPPEEDPPVISQNPRPQPNPTPRPRPPPAEDTPPPQRPPPQASPSPDPPRPTPKPPVQEPETTPFPDLEPETPTPTVPTTSSTPTTSATPILATLSQEVVTTPTTPIIIPTTYNVPSATFGSAIVSGSTSALPSQTAASSGGASVGSIIGIAAGVIGGLGVIAAVILFYLRRKRRVKEEEYQEENYRGQSMVLPDEDPVSRYEGGPRPPTMFERKYNNQAPSFPQTFGGGYDYPQHGSAYDSQQYGYGDQSPSFSPGQVITSPTSAMPFVPAATAPSAYLTRTPSNNSNEGHPHHGYDDAYADVNRASVTPFQEQQYVEISRQLNIPPPASPARAMTADVSPFADQQDRVPVASKPPMLPDHRAMSPIGVPTSATHSSFAIPVAPAPVAQAGQPGQKRPNTVYDEDDAYGGF